MGWDGARAGYSGKGDDMGDVMGSDLVGLGSMLRLLGPVELEVGGSVVRLGGPRQRSILAFLALHPHTVSFEGIVEGVWGGVAPLQVRRSLSTQVARLRRVIGPAGATIVHTGSGYRLQAPVGWTDVAQFETGVATGRSLLAEGLVDDGLAAFAHALGLWRGPAMGDLAEAAFVREMAPVLESHRHTAEDEVVDVLMRCGRYATAIEHSRAMVSELPYAEGRWAVLIDALIRVGQGREALAAFEQVRRLLADVGMVPGMVLRDLERQALGIDSVASDATGGTAVDPAWFVQFAADRLASPAERYGAALIAAEMLVERRDLATAQRVLQLAVDEGTEPEAMHAGLKLGIVELAAGTPAGVSRLEDCARWAEEQDRWDMVADTILARAHLAVAVSQLDGASKAQHALDVADHLDDTETERRIRLWCWAADLLVNVDIARSKAVLAQARQLLDSVSRPDLDSLAMLVRLRLREALNEDPFACRNDAERLAGHAARYGARAVAASAHVAALAARLRAGDIRGCRAAIPAARAAIGGFDDHIAPVELRAVEVAIDLATGILEDANRASESGLEVASAHGLTAALVVRGLHLILIRREQERLHEVRAMVESFGVASPRPIIEVVGACIDFEIGQVGRAGQRAEVVLAGVPDLNRDWAYPGTLAMLADLACNVAAVDGSLVELASLEQLHTDLLPFEDQSVVLASYLAILGRAQGYLGALALSLGNLDEAIERCADARRVDADQGCDLWAAWASVTEAQARHRRQATGDRSQVQALVAAAAATGERVGSVRLCNAAADVLSKG